MEVPSNALGEPMPHIVRASEHRALFNSLGLIIGSWVRLPDGRYGRVWTYPGGDEHGKVSVGIDGASQFGSGERVMVPVSELSVCDLPSLADQRAVEEWLDA
jgi:hypothetical protein